MARTQRITDKQIIDALMQTNGLILPASIALGCNMTTIYARAKQNDVIRELIDEKRKIVAGVAVSKLYEAILRGEPWAVSLGIKTFEPMENPQSGGDSVISVNVTYETRHQDT